MDLHTAKEIAERLRVSIAAVRAWQRQGLPCIPVGRLRRYQFDAVLEWLRKRSKQQERLQE